MIDPKTADMFKFMNKKGDGMKKVNGLPMMADGKTPDVKNWETNWKLFFGRKLIRKS